MADYYRLADQAATRRKLTNQSTKQHCETGMHRGSETQLDTLARGSTDILSELISRHDRHLKSIFYGHRLIYEPGDLVQEVWLRVVRTERLHTARFNTSRCFKSWLRGIARNVRFDNRIPADQTDVDLMHDIYSIADRLAASLPGAEQEKLKAKKKRLCDQVRRRYTSHLTSSFRAADASDPSHLAERTLRLITESTDAGERFDPERKDFVQHLNDIARQLWPKIGNQVGGGGKPTLAREKSNDDDVETLCGGAIDPEQRKLIFECFEGLKRSDRSAILLVYVQGHEKKQAAARMGVALGTFNNMLSRGGRALRKCLKHRQPSDASTKKEQNLGTH